MLTPSETNTLRALLSREATDAAGIDTAELSSGDIAQIRPLSDRTLGGLLFFVTQALPYQVRGYLLRPHRGGCREAWLSFHHGDLERIGRPYFPAPEFSRRRECFDALICPHRKPVQSAGEISIHQEISDANPGRHRAQDGRG